MGSTPNVAPSAAPPSALTSSQQLALLKIALNRRVQSGAHWFFWITGLSILNSIISLGGGRWRFIIGLGITQIVDAVAAGAKLGTGIPLVLDILASGIFVFFGLQARKRRNWAFLTGMILYALDMLLLALFKDILGIGFHLYALYFIYRGMKANEKLEALERGILS